MSAEVLFERRAGIARLTLNRASVKNALTSSMCTDICACIASTPVAIREMKSLVRCSQERTIAEQFAAEVESLGTCAATQDFIEAINAFATTRSAMFTRR